jgi:hypothetical protein
VQLNPELPELEGGAVTVTGVAAVAATVTGNEEHDRVSEVSKVTKMEVGPRAEYSELYQVCVVFVELTVVKL